jgi:hypothetical protein
LGSLAGGLARARSRAKPGVGNGSEAGFSTPLSMDAHAQKHGRLAREPLDELEPSTPSLPWSATHGGGHASAALGSLFFPMGRRRRRDLWVVRGRPLGRTRTLDSSCESAAAEAQPLIRYRLHPQRLGSWVPPRFLHSLMTHNRRSPFQPRGRSARRETGPTRSCRSGDAERPTTRPAEHDRFRPRGRSRGCPCDSAVGSVRESRQ